MTVQTNLEPADTKGRGAAEPGLRSRDLQRNRQKTVAGLSPDLLGRAVLDSFRKLDPRTLWRNPVMFVVEIVSLLTTIIVVRDLFVGTSVLFSA
jgi:hypothetical protein